MKTMISIFFFTGFIFLLSFIIGCIFVFGKNSSMKLKSAYSVYLALILLLYLVSALIVCAGAVFYNKTFYLSYLVFALTPFIIGKLTSFKTLKFYTGLQIAVIFTGCILSFFHLVN